MLPVSLLFFLTEPFFLTKSSVPVPDWWAGNVIIIKRRQQTYGRIAKHSVALFCYSQFCLFWLNLSQPTVSYFIRPSNALQSCLHFPIPHHIDRCFSFRYTSVKSRAENTRHTSKVTWFKSFIFNFMEREEYSNVFRLTFRVQTISYVSPYYQQASHFHTAPDDFFIRNKKENVDLQRNASLIISPLLLKLVRYILIQLVVGKRVSSLHKFIKFYLKFDRNKKLTMCVFVFFR